MKNIRTITELKGRPFNGRVHLRIKRIRVEPRQKIRQLLRSFLPLYPSHIDTHSDQNDL